MIAADCQIGIVGLGGIGRVHLENLAEGIHGARLAWAVDRDRALAEEVGAKYGVPWSTELQDVLHSPEVDAILIATPPQLHAQMVHDAATAAKHVFCEKPLAVDQASARLAAEAVEESGIHFQIGFHRRFDPEFMTLKNLVSGVGRVYQYHGSMRDKEPGDGAAIGTVPSLIEATCHEFDAARWLVGEIASVSVAGTTTRPELQEAGEPDNTIVTLRFENGTIGSIETSRVAGYGFDCRAEVLAEFGTLRAGEFLGTPNPPAGDESEIISLRSDDAGLNWPQTYLDRFTKPCYAAELEAFADSVRTGRAPQPGLRDALAALAISLASLESLESAQSVSVPSVEEFLGTRTPTG